MFFQLLFIHLFRPFLKYTQATSPLPQTVSPRKLCTQAAAMISKLLRLYKRSHGLRQICNIVVYIAHSACTIHLLNLPDKNARRDIIHGCKALEEMAEGWLGARRTLTILSVLARKWNIEMPEEASAVLTRAESKFGAYTGDISSPTSEQNRALGSVVNAPAQTIPQHILQAQTPIGTPDGLYTETAGADTPASRPQTSSATGNVPTRNVGSLRMQQIQPPTSTPQRQQMSGQHSSHNPMQPRPMGASPSDMFGGVDQLLRDSQDWAYRDQAQLATGFGNWNLDAADPAPSWMSGTMGDANTSFPMQSQVQPQQQQQQQQQQPIPTTAQNMPPAYTMGNGGGVHNAADANAFAVMSWMNGANPYTNMTSYDEEEWYR